jgi:hypothetical protein
MAAGRVCARSCATGSASLRLPGHGDYFGA